VKINASSFSVVAPLLLMGCFAPPQPALPQPVSVPASQMVPITAPANPANLAKAPASPWAGRWEGMDSRGDTYIFRLTDTEWESYYERNGNVVPFFRGTYSYSGGRAELQIRGEVDASTMKWKAVTIAYPAISGSLNGNQAILAGLTDAELMKK